MKLPESLYQGTLLRRYKRFLADVLLEDGYQVTVHCPNSGSMMGCSEPGSTVLLSLSEKPGRKYPFTWEMVRVGDTWVGINTARPNALVLEAVRSKAVPELEGYDSIRTEVRYGTNSRIDLLLSGPSGLCHVEIKNVTLMEGDAALFPDAATERGRKHLRELIRVVEQGGRGVIFFVVQRGDATRFAPADGIDPEYGRLLRTAVKKGVEALAYRAIVTPRAISLSNRLPICLSATAPDPTVP